MMKDDAHDGKIQAEKLFAQLIDQSTRNVQLGHGSFITMEWGEDISLSLFSYTTRIYEHWMLYTPTHHVFVAGPGNQWTYERSDKSE